MKKNLLGISAVPVIKTGYFGVTLLHKITMQKVFLLFTINSLLALSCSLFM